MEVGQITQEEARDHPQRNIIYRVVGDKPEPEYDLFEQVLLPGEALLLCSDGLSGMLTDEEIWEFWRAYVVAAGGVCAFGRYGESSWRFG